MSNKSEFLEVPVSDGKAATLIDAVDAHKVVPYKWCFNRVTNGKKYVHRRLPKDQGGKMIKLHRVIMGVTGDRTKSVDHINGDALDNRRCNLRVCNQGENMRNYRYAWGKEGIRGIQRTPGGKFRARIRYKRKLYEIGTFDTMHDASIAYAFASSLLHGDFGSLPGPERFMDKGFIE